MNKKAARGFTLIELVIVVVILGILAATALPRFVDFTADARAGATKGYAGALASAVAIANSKCVVSGGACTGATATSVTLATGVSIMMANGFPDTAGTYTVASNAGAVTAASGGFLWQALMGSAPPTELDFSTSGGVITIKNTKATTSANCAFTLNASGVVSTSGITNCG